MKKQYLNGPRKGMMYGGTATKPRKKAQMGGMMQSSPMMQQPQQQKPTMQPPLSMSMAMGGKEDGLG